MISPYRPAAEGRLIPELPGQGPCASWDERPCQLASDHDRERKTGPRFPLRVLRCRTHGHGLTLYPPGHFPYGRKRLAPVAFDGSWERQEGGTGAERFRSTYFEAALDAAQGKAWPQHSYAGSLQERFPTQRRQLRRAARLVGVWPELAPKKREGIAELLAVPGQLLHEGTQGLNRGRGYQRLGQSVCEVLQALPGWSSLFERLCECGFWVGEWPAPYRCPGPEQALHRSPFRLEGTRPPPAPR